MKRQKISECIGGMDEKYIDEANTFTYAGRRMGWKKWAAIAACLAVVGIAVILGIATTQTRDYTLRHEGMYTYLQFSEKMQDDLNNSSLNDMVAVPAIKFESLSDMKRKIESGSLTALEIYELSRFEKNNNGEVLLPNLAELRAPVLPACLTANGVMLYDYGYSQGFVSSDSEMWGSWLLFTDNQDYTDSYEENYMARAGDETYKHYQISVKTGTLYVMEDGKLDMVWIFGETSVGNFIVRIRHPSLPLTEEFLSQFGIKPFAE